MSVVDGAAAVHMYPIKRACGGGDASATQPPDIISARAEDSVLRSSFSRIFASNFSKGISHFAQGERPLSAGRNGEQASSGCVLLLNINVLRTPNPRNYWV